MQKPKESFNYSKKDANALFLISCAQGNLKWVKKSLLAGADINSYEDEAITYACWNGHLHILKFLIKTNRKINKQFSLNFDNPFLLARPAKDGYLNIISYLVERENFNINISNGKTLEWACEAGQIHIVKYLFDKNAQFNEDKLFNLSLKNKHIDTIEFLISKTNINKLTETTVYNILKFLNEFKSNMLEEFILNLDFEINFDKLNLDLTPLTYKIKKTIEQKKLNKYLKNTITSTIDEKGKTKI